jgi:hypothetical protein
MVVSVRAQICAIFVEVALSYKVVVKAIFNEGRVFDVITTPNISRRGSYTCRGNTPLEVIVYLWLLVKPKARLSPNRIVEHAYKRFGLELFEALVGTAQRLHLSDTKSEHV